MARSYANARKKKKQKRPHGETITAADEAEPPPKFARHEQKEKQQRPQLREARNGHGGDDIEETGGTVVDEVEWQDDDFLAFGPTVANRKNDHRVRHKMDSNDDVDKAAAAAAPAAGGGHYDSMEEQADDMEESSASSDSSSPSSSSERDAMSTPPWLLLRKIHQQQHRHRSSSSHNPRVVTSSPLVDLHNEMLQFVGLMEPLETERVSRQAVIQDLQAAVLTEFGPSAQLLVLGSQATGLFLPTSDIDLTLQYSGDDDDNDNDIDIVNSNTNEKDTQQHQRQQQASSYNPLYKKPIHRFSDLMSSKEWKDRLSYLETIEATRVPIVKMRFAATDIAVDVSFNQPNGVTAAALMTEYLKAMPPLRPLTIILKYFLAARDLNEPYSGGVGSYLLQLLIVSFLQQRERAAYHVNMSLDYNLGGLLLDFFELYGLDFNYLVTGLSVRFDGFYYRKGHVARHNCISVENPLDVSHDVGSSSYRFSMVQRSFAIAYKMLMAIITPGPKPPATSTSVLSSILPTSPYMISRLVVKRRDVALSVPRHNNGPATAAAAKSRGRQRPPPPSPPPPMGSSSRATIPTSRIGSGGGATSSSAPPTWNGVGGALSAPRYGTRTSQDPRQKRKTDY